jgi:two-component system cell cycle sensor histidine kinase/response regulator CckA
MKILIVDDNPNNRKSLGMTLCSAGHEIREASDGIEALEALRAEAFDAVISDILMPRMDGYRLCYEMRRDERIRGLPFIVYTSTFTSTADEAVAIEAGADRFIRNPASVTELEKALQEITSAHSKGDTAARAFAAIEVLKQYNEGLVWRLKEKNVELEKAIRDLRTEIQDRRAAEEALRESEERYRGIFENNLAGVFRSTADGRLVECNEAFARMFGYESPAEIKAQPLQNLYPNPKARQDFVAHVREMGSITDMETLFVRKDGLPMWALDNVRIVSQPGEQPEILDGTLVDITDRKLAELTLRESEERYRNLIEQSHAWICTHDLEGKLLSVNSVAAALLGYDSGAMAGRNLRDVIAPEFRSGFEAYLDEIQNTGSSDGFMTLLRSDGGKRTLEYRNVLQTTASGEKIVQGVALDVTARFEAEHAVRASEQRNRALMENAKDGIFVSSTDGIILQVNRAVEELQGRSRGEIVGSALAGLVPPEEREKVGRALATGIAEGSVAGFETFSLRADGTKVPVEVSASLVDVGGEQLIHAIVRDVTERKQTQQALRDSEERYRDIFDASPLPKWLYSMPDLRILDVNQAAIDHYGYSREEFLAMTLFDLRPPEDADRLRETIRTVVDRPARRYVGIWKHRKKDGTLIDVDVHTHSVVLGGQNVQLALMLDVTERLRLEEQFGQAQKLEGIGQLAGGIAHDFNNLLMIVQSYSDLLETHIADENAIRRDIAEIRGAAVRGAAMTGQLLAFSRKQIVRPQIFEPCKVVADLRKMLRRLIREDIQLEIRVEQPAAGFIEIDRGQLEQVLVNLVVNARDAMPTGGRITIDVRRVELDEAYAASHAGVKPGPFVQITVTDTGTGMDALTKSRIFEPFFTTKEVGRGTGLGLATVYGIVKGSGGDVWVYSEPGHGSAFKIYLPRVAAPAAAATAERPAERAASNGTETLLILEDEEVIREMLREYLERLGYRVLEAGNGDDALRIAREHAEPIHLLLTDVIVPGRSGRNVAEVLLRENPSLRVIFMSGYTDDAAVVRDVMANEVDFLQKPFGMELLTRKIREVLDRVKV